MKQPLIFQKIGLLKKSDIKNEDPENRAYRKYLYHGISHHLGIDVHDLGTKSEPIKAGNGFYDRTGNLYRRRTNGSDGLKIIFGSLKMEIKI